MSHHELRTCSPSPRYRSITSPIGTTASITIPPSTTASLSSPPLPLTLSAQEHQSIFIRETKEATAVLHFWMRWCELQREAHPPLVADREARRKLGRLKAAGVRSSALLKRRGWALPMCVATNCCITAVELCEGSLNDPLCVSFMSY